MIDKAQPELKQIILSGSFYQKLVNQMIQDKQTQIKNNLILYQTGNYNPIKLDLDIRLISPKIFIHESIMTQKVLDPKDVPAIVVDLGRVDVRTHLVEKKRNVDYG